MSGSDISGHTGAGHDGAGHTHAAHERTGDAEPSAAELSAAGDIWAGPRVHALAITVSNRAAAGVYEDRSGPVLARLLADAGCVVDGPLVVPDGEPVESALREAVSAGYDVVVTTGGTGITPTDLTPEMTRRVLDREIPGIAEAIRAAGTAQGVPAAMLSRGLAGLAGRTLIANLPGSAGGVKDGMSVLAAVLSHAVDQAHGGDHPRA